MRESTGLWWKQWRAMHDRTQICKLTKNCPYLPIKTLFWPQWPPLALTASADHSFTHRHHGKPLPEHHSYMLHPSTAQNPTPVSVLTPYVVEGFGGEQRGWKKSHLCALHLSEACVCHPAHRGNSEAGGQVLREPLHVSGVVVMGD